ncbi:endonuclease dU [Deinococcus cellulosilyticus]|uniref:UPF0215 protein n=1 Tax=Deinococcus cellulosilyticus (strain DSM 18568 / NBRC 106333 / KACC 11606 / 5516J-15) TaxID=1223518 RepID=A0A511N1P5_DEIC1|nr:DUF99 family protein [Deinococcus cellulosilyticus]GEM46793.1 UPF0215 protein [Deinococcus cellulosilyticus NBRC 106333 = KACC 11606]
MRESKLSHAIGFDDFPFERSHRGDIPIVGTVYAGQKLEGILSAKIRRDGVNSTRVIANLVLNSKFYDHTQLILLQGIALGGFNVMDIHELSALLDRPVLVVSRRKPNMEKIKDALLNRVPGGKRKWHLIQKAGEMEAASGVYVQRAGLTLEQAEQVIQRFAICSNIPEPLRAAHLIAGGMATGQSRARP